MTEAARAGYCRSNISCEWIQMGSARRMASRAGMEGVASSDSASNCWAVDGPYPMARASLTVRPSSSTSHNAAVDASTASAT